MWNRFLNFLFIAICALLLLVLINLHIKLENVNKQILELSVQLTKLDTAFKTIHPGVIE